MQTDRIRVAIRSRRGWEAVDLGFRMARTWWRPLFGAWIAVVVPIAVAVHLLLRDYLWVAPLVIWWLKPAFDRVALYVLSESLFGHVPRVAESIAALPSLLRTGVLRSLLWQRLTPLRSFSMPVMQLEGARGMPRRERTRLLIGRDTHVGLGLFFACVHFEAVLWLGLLFLLWGFLPETSSTGFFDFAFSEQPARELLVTGVYVVSMSIVEPFYVAGGFGLYVNRRMYLEGWDIDLIFRRLAQRVPERPRAQPGAAILPALVCLIALGALFAQPARAEDPVASADEVACAAERPQDAAECIAEVMQDPEFDTERSVTIWVPRWKGEAATVQEPDPGLLASLGRLLSVLLESSVWVLLILGGLLLGYQLARRAARARPEPGEQAAQPELRFGLDVRPESLPDDVIAAARARWAQGDAIGALSLLYRGALVHLIRVRGLELPVSATEGECTRIAERRLDAPLARDFTELTSAWQYCAYGRREPGSETFLELCRRWQLHLETDMDAGLGTGLEAGLEAGPGAAT